MATGQRGVKKFYNGRYPIKRLSVSRKERTDHKVFWQRCGVCHQSKGCGVAV